MLSAAMSRRPVLWRFIDPIGEIWTLESRKSHADTKFWQCPNCVCSWIKSPFAAHPDVPVPSRLSSGVSGVDREDVIMAITALDTGPRRICRYRTTPHLRRKLATRPRIFPSDVSDSEFSYRA